MSDDVERRLIDAIQHQRLDSVAPDADGRAARALATCRRIAEAVHAEREHVEQLLRAHGIDVPATAPTRFAQRHAFDLGLHHDDARLAADLLIAEGFERHPEWARGADRSFWTTADQLTLARTDRWTTVVRLRWPVVQRLPGVLRPRPGDWSMVDLPGWAWPAYSLVRPIRLLVERTGLRRRDHAALEPFLATPTSLLDPLLDLADVRPDDLVADIGCGDGRIVVEAARRRGCRAIGAEYSPKLADRARKAVMANELAERVEIVEGDGLALPLDEVTVVLLFLPMTVAAQVIPAVLDRLPAGARVVTHEQAPLHAALPAPTVSRALIGTDAVSVGHRWDV